MRKLIQSCAVHAVASIPVVIAILLSLWGMNSIGQSAHKTGKEDGSQAAKWIIVNDEDKITGQQTLKARITVPADANGRHGEAEITATCSAGYPSFDIVYDASFQRDLGFIYIQPDATVQANGAVAIGAYVPPTTGTVHANPPYIQYRANIEGTPITLNSKMEHPNELFLVFVTGNTGNVSDSQKSVPYVRGLSELTGPLTIIPYQVALTKEAVYGAKLIRVELPLANGDRPVVDIHPLDPSFRVFASRCPGSGVHPPDSIDGVTLLPASEFEARLPSILSKAAEAHGLATHAYDKELGYIHRFLKTCVEATGIISNPAADEYEICQTRSYKGGYAGNDLKDVSVLIGAEHGQSPEGGKLRIGDLLMRTGQPMEKTWDPAGDYWISLEIITNIATGRNFGINTDKVLNYVHIPSSAHKPAPASAPTAVEVPPTPLIVVGRGV